MSSSPCYLCRTRDRHTDKMADIQCCFFCAWAGRPVCAVVQRPLQPLDGGRLHGVAQQRHQVASQAAAALRPHGVPLVGHGTGTWTHDAHVSNISDQDGKWVCPLSYLGNRVMTKGGISIWQYIAAFLCAIRESIHWHRISIFSLNYLFIYIFLRQVTEKLSLDHE